MLREDAIEDVIRQFADPMAFLRELVQNALDAGSSEVDLSFDYDEERGTGVVIVTDWGEGMTREIVESRLVRLFNSTKDDDFTKIGKFGIGFVSVFAVSPIVVCVDTGRDGEYWRVLLHPDRTYELLALEDPVEGTSVAVHLGQTEEEFSRFVEQARDKVTQWCRFAPVPVLFSGEDIREPFDLDGLIVSHFEEEGTRIVAALQTSPDGLGQFFNGGLALQTVRSDWPHVSFMMDSRFLEHTLTRDQVLQNKKFHAAVDRLREIVEVQLRADVEQGLATWAADPDRLWDWDRLCGVALATLEPKRQTTKYPAIRRPLQTFDEVKAARERNRLMLTYGRSHLAARMPEDYVLLDIRPDSRAARWLQAGLGRETPVLEDIWVQPVVVDARATNGADALASEVDAALRILGSHPTWVGFAQFDYPYSGFETRGFLCSPDRRAVHHRADLTAFKMSGIANDVLLNPTHPIVSDAIAVAVEEREWAAYTLVKCAALAVEAVEYGQLDGETDAALALAMLDRRSKRLGQ